MLKTLADYRCAPPHNARAQGGRRLQRLHPPSDPPSDPAQPLISVVTVCLNSRTGLLRTLESVKAQGYANIEHIVIDGGSSDGTLELLKARDNDLALWISEPDAGIFDAMNKGVAAATGQFIGILNAEDIYLPQAVNLALDALRRSGADAVYSDFVYHVADVNLFVPIAASLELQRGMTLGHPALFVSREFYEKLNGYSPGYRYAGDLDFAWRLKNAGAKWTKAPSALACFASGGVTEHRLGAATWESAGVVAKYAGPGRQVLFLLDGLKRLSLRGGLSLVRVLLGARAYLWLKKSWYARKLNKSQARS